MKAKPKARAKSKQRRGKTANRPDPYQLVTDQVIRLLEKGVVPWRCPWNREVGKPRNFHSGKAYQGANVMLLGCRYAASPWWMTFRQALERGGHVRKGERGAMVVKYGTFSPQGEDANANASNDGAKTGKERKAMFLRAYTVFNASQIEGIQFPDPIPSPKLGPEQRIQRAEEIVAAMPQRPSLIEAPWGTRAFYSSAVDEVHVPALGRFQLAEDYYRTLFHELAHATGHASRLNRETMTRHGLFGDEVYSREELVAEMGAAFVGMEAGIVTDSHEQSAAYLQNWLIQLKSSDHRRWIVQAASQAARAADFILGQSNEGEEKETSTE